MRNDPMKPQVTTAVYAGSEPGTGTGEGEPIDLGWWLTGGGALLAWTGFAMLLTA